MLTCSLDNCEKAVKDGEQPYCRTHYYRVHRYGDPHVIVRVGKSGNTKHPLYGTWYNMKSRCSNKKGKQYHWYGGRGITVCDRWQGIYGFQNFVEDMGEKPSSKHTLDRIDNDGNYEPVNCRWATIMEQAANRRDNNSIVGVSYNRHRNRYTVTFKHKTIGSFKDHSEAVVARRNAEINDKETP